MDEKPRMKSLYMKKYNDRLKKVAVGGFDPRPAGTRNFMRPDISVDEPAHLNQSRRRILNDFVSIRAPSNESLGNRNVIDVTMGSPGPSSAQK